MVSALYPIPLDVVTILLVFRKTNKKKRIKGKQES